MTARSRLSLLVGAGIALAVLVIAFAGLFFWVPDRWSPVTGWAPRMRDAFVWLVPGDGGGAPTAPWFRFWGLALLVAMWGSYLLGLHTLRRMTDPDERHRALRVVVGISLAAQAFLILVPPLLSEDLYRYALFGRMVSHYGLNPMVTPGDAIAHDPLWRFADWTDMATNYGPTFTWLSALATSMAGSSVYGTAVAFKTLAVVFNIGGIWAIGCLARERGDGDGLGAVALYAWNPMVLVETAGSGHNDAEMAALALLGVLFLQRKRPAPGFLLLLASATVKFVTASILGMFLVHHIFQAPGAGARVRRAAGWGGLLLVVLLLLYAPFWSGREGLVSTLQLLFAGKSAVTGGPAPVLSRLLMGGFLICVLLAMITAARAEWPTLFVMAGAVMLIFVVFVYSWQYPWYVIPGLAITIAGPRTRTNQILLAAMLLIAFFLTVPYTSLGSTERP